MKGAKILTGIIGILFLLIILTAASHANVPGEINYQGYLTDDLGDPVADGNYQMRFIIYDAATGGTDLWHETHTTVMVVNGIYNVILGQLIPLNPNYFDGDLYLGVTVSGDSEMTPRQKLTSTSFAMKAAVADDADTLDGLDSADLDQSSHLSDYSNPHGVTPAQIGAASDSDFSTHESKPSVHHAKTTRFTELTDTASDSQIPGTITRDSELSSGLALKADLGHDHDTRYYSKGQIDSIVAAQESRINALETLLANVTKNGNEITFSGVNVKIVNGTGSTQGTVNGTGNLIVGYNELRGSGDVRTGSHNIVVGGKNNYSSYGGLIAGYYNTVSGQYSTAGGGRANIASGDYASVSGGHESIASGMYASVSGGRDNIASGDYASVSGGNGNKAIGSGSSVSGGRDNIASGMYANVSGGGHNEASGESSFAGGGGGDNLSEGNEAFADYSVVLGGMVNIAGDPALFNHSIGVNSVITAGLDNKASGDYANVSGGQANKATGAGSSVRGGYNNEATGAGSSVSAGYGNDAIGNYANISGGHENTASGMYASVRGGYNNEASNTYASVSGGRDNIASGDYTNVSGGRSNTASGDYASVSGGQISIASGMYASVSGGHESIASGMYASVSGGEANEASGPYSTVSGGVINTASGNSSSVSGGNGNTASGSSSSVSGGEIRAVTGVNDWRAGSLWENY